VRTSSNPVFRNLPAQGGYASFGPGQTGQQSAPQGYGQQGYGQQPYGQPQPYTTGRTMTVDDVVTKTASTLGALVVTAGISAFLISQNNSLALPFLLVGGIVGFVLVLVATLGRKMNPVIVLSYGVAEGLFVGAISYVLEATTVGTIVPQAVIGTVGVFVGMLVVYKTGAVRVTPRLTKMVMAGLIGVVVLVVANIIAGFFVDGGLGLRDGGPLAIIFSLVIIALAAFNLLLDFDQADKLIRAGAPEKAAWGVALGLTVTLVWLYVEILRLLSYFNRG
jgi:uncharacterized YccA/Bax inhibitor family protein